MAEHDYVIANDTGANVRSDINNVLSAIVSQNSKGTEPTTKFAYMFWADTGNDLLKQRNAANNAWISILTLSTGAVTSATTELSADTSPALGGFLDANGNYIQMQKGGDIASASPTVIDTDGDYFICTGTTGFSAMTVAADRHFFLEFAGALTMTHGAGTLDLPGGANITTAAGDVGEFVSTASNVVTCVNYSRAGGILNADINASAAIADTKISLGTAIQAYDSDTAKTDADQSWTGSQRATLVTDNDGSFDMNAGQNFKCTPSGNFTLTFTNFANGQSGFIILVNSGGHTVALHGNSKADANLATTVTTAGTYILNYISDGTNAYLTNSAVMA